MLALRLPHPQYVFCTGQAASVPDLPALPPTPSSLPLPTPPPPARRVDEELERVLNDTQRRMKRENDAVFMQPVPSEAPPLPDGKRLASSVAYALPPPTAEVKDGVVERCFAAGPAAAMQAPAVATMSAGGAAAGAGSAAAGAAAAAGGDGSAPAEQGCSCCRCGLDQCGCWEGLPLCVKHLHCHAPALPA